MRKLVYGLIFLVFLALVAAVVIPQLVPTSVYKNEIQARISQELGREVRIEGDLNLSVLPVIKASAGRVTIANADGFSEEHFAAMDGLDARIKLWPLLSRRVEIDHFTLKRPVVNLEKKPDGRANWVFGDPQNPPAPAPETETETGPFKRDGRFANIDPQIGKFSLEDGYVSYADATTGTNLKLENANLHFALPSLSAPIKIDGDVIANGTPVALTLNLDTPRSFLDGQETPVSGQIETGFTKAKWKGRFLEGEDILFDMELDGNVSSISTLISYIPPEMLSSVSDYTGLAETLEFSGQYSYDGTIVTAKAANLRIEGPDFNASYQGDATLSETPVLDGKLEAKLQDAPRLARALGQDMTGLDLVKTADISANFVSEGQTFVIPALSAAVSGDAINARFNGQGHYNETLSLQGDFDGKANGIPALLDALAIDIPQARALDKADIAGNLDMKGENFDVRIDRLKADSTILTADYTGTVAKKGDAVNASGDFDVTIPDMQALNTAAKLNIAQTAALGAVSAKGRLSYSPNATQVTGLTATLSQGQVNGRYTGNLDYAAGTVRTNGDFDVAIPDMQALNTSAQLNITQAAALGTVSAKGQLSHNPAATQITGLSTILSNGRLNGTYTGDVNYSTSGVTTNGTFDVAIPDMKALNDAAGLGIKEAAAIGAVTTTGTLAYSPSETRVSGLVAELRDGQLNGRFAGEVSQNQQNKALVFAGDMVTDIPSLRALAKTTGTDLPPSTQSGVIYERLHLDGRLDGTMDGMRFSRANLTIDDLVASGDVMVSLSGTKPFITSTLNLAELDLRPYMAAYAAQRPTGKVEPWSEAPLNLSPLKTIDGDFTLNTSKIITPQMSMNTSSVDVTLRNGKLEAKMPTLSLFGGQGSLTAALDASRATPKIDFSAGLNGLDSNSFLNAAAGFANATGTGGITFNFSGQGLSQAAIMKSLAGGGNFKLQNGQIQGVDMVQALSSFDLENTLTQRQLPTGIGQQYITKFQDILGGFEIRNGVATIGNFDMSAVGFAAKGGGSLDLGNQTIDFRLQPRLTRSDASALARYGIPLRFTGTFGSVQPSLDTDGVGQLLARVAQDRARQELSNRLGNQLGGSAGAILGGVLGGNSGGQPAGTQQGQTRQGQTQQPQRQQPSVEDVLGGLLGGGQRRTGNTEEQNPQNQQAQEPTVEDVLGGLFGGRKKKDDDDD